MRWNEIAGVWNTTGSAVSTLQQSVINHDFVQQEQSFQTFVLSQLNCNRRAFLNYPSCEMGTFFRVLYWNPSEFSTGPLCSIVMFRDENSFVWGQEIKVRHLSYGANVSLEVFSHLGIFICFSFDWPLSKQSQVLSFMFLVVLARFNAFESPS